MADATQQTFRLPDLGEGLTEAEVVRWLVAEEEELTVDQSVCEVETAKSIVEVPTPFAGRVVGLHVAEGATVEVGMPLLTVAASAGSGQVLVGYGTSDPPAAGRRRRPRGAARVAIPDAPAATSRVPLVVSPLVRKLARDAGLDLETLDGTGPNGAITRADVVNALDDSSASPAAVAVTADESAVEQRLPLSGFRKAVSAVLTRSRAEIPEATVWVDVDATALWELRTSRQPGPGLLAYVARFVVAGLREFPVLNSRLDVERQEIVVSHRINLGLAVQTDRGLVVPAVPGAETMTTSRLDEEIRRVTTSALEHRSTTEELTAGTFTLNNYGSFRVDGSAAIINHPQVAILGLGRIMDRPWAVDGQVRVRKVAQLSLAFDHRVCDGGPAAGFLRSVADAMEDPAAAIARL